MQQRVRVHAALADPARLRITDRLAEGDASPGELQALLAMPSNLLAHHLRVLEDAGVVARRRSEADRRRSYVRLLPGALEGAAPRPVAASRVLFVCTANSARSQLAAALWSTASEVPAASAGTHPAPGIAAGARQTAERHGLRLVQQEPRLLDEVAADGDYVVAVCDRAYEELDPAGVRAHWSVPDPVRVGRRAAFEAAYDELATRVAQLAPRLVPEASA
ncbi:helix-turn-helix domain-containing protein [Nocardioides aestuarii]